MIGVLVRRGVDFATAEDAVQEALLQAALTWPGDQPADPKGWLVTVAWRKFLDAHRSETARRDREKRVEDEPPPGPTESADDTLQLFFLCAHPSLTPASAVALTLRAVGGLTTRQIAQAYLVPEATMAQRISRAKRTVGDVRFEEPGDLATVLRVLYLVFNEGYTGDVDLAAEAIRLSRQLASMTDDEEAAGLLALMLLHHARRPARTRTDGSLVPLAEQDRSRWDTRSLRRASTILQTALARDRLGEFQAQAAIAALHADAQRAEETDWVQIVSWYDELLRLTGSPVVELNRAVAIGEADGARGRPRGPGRRGPRPAPPHRGLGVPAREGGRPADRGRAVRRRRSVGPQPRRTRPPHSAGGPDQSAGPVRPALMRVSCGHRNLLRPSGFVDPEFLADEEDHRIVGDREVLVDLRAENVGVRVRYEMHPGQLGQHCVALECRRLEPRSATRSDDRVRVRMHRRRQTFRSWTGAWDRSRVPQVRL